MAHPRHIRFAKPGQTSGGFTLIELILVMAMLVIVLAVATPSLSRFFRGRNLDAEAKRFLALTRYGQSRAVSEGVPMVLWIDAQQGAYGLEAESSFTEEDPRAVEFKLDSTLEIETERPAISTLMPSAQLNQGAQGRGNLPTIRFTPDGFFTATSPERVVLRQGQEQPVWIGLSRNRLNYEIKTNLLEIAQW